MKTTTHLKKIAFIFFGFFLSFFLNAENELEPMAEGMYEPTWTSLGQYHDAPEWFKNAKFGIWAHWGPQCEPEAGDWYARHMYYPGQWQYNEHWSKYGNPNDFGFKDVIHAWKAAEWDPDALMALYKKAGIRYFFTLANHHDNMDLWDSQYQPWNSKIWVPRETLLVNGQRLREQMIYTSV